MSRSVKIVVVELVVERGQTGSWSRIARVFTKIAWVVEGRIVYMREYSG